MTYGYARVSSKDQNPERQLLQLQGAGVSQDHIYVDKASGKNFNRPQWCNLIDATLPCDTIIVTSLDRLGRNYTEIQETWRTLVREKGLSIRVLDMPLLDTSGSKDLMGTFVSDIVLTILSFVAENERTNIKERQAAGIAAARARGVHLGRPATEASKFDAHLAGQVLVGELSRKRAAAINQMPYSTWVYYYNCWQDAQR